MSPVYVGISLTADVQENHETYLIKSLIILLKSSKSTSLFPLLEKDIVRSLGTCHLNKQGN